MENKTSEEIIHENNFTSLAKEFNSHLRMELVDFLMQKDGWKPTEKGWKKLVSCVDKEGEELSVIIKPTESDNVVDQTMFFYEAFKLAKGYLKENHVFYHEPTCQMITRAKIAVIFACAVKFNGIKNRVYKNENFTGFLGI